MNKAWQLRLIIWRIFIKKRYEQAVLEKLRELPPEKQQEVLDFADFLHQKVTPKRPLRSVKGLWADLKLDITEDDIAQARKEMWGNFPRDYV